MAGDRRGVRGASRMSESGDHGKDPENTSGDPTGLVDVYIPPKQAVWIVTLFLLVSACMVAASRIPFSLPIMSRVTMLAISAVVGLAVGTAVRGVRALWQRRIRSVVASLLAQQEDATVEELIERTVLERRGAFPQMYLQALAQLLPTCGRVGITVRNCPPKHTTPIEPFTVTFEPRALDEADESVVELENAMEAQHATQPGLLKDGQKHPEVIPEIQRMKRNLTLAGGRYVLTFFALLIGGLAFLYYVTGQMGPLIMMVLPLLLILFYRPGGGWQTGRKQWLLVPGGIVVREGRRLGPRCRVHLIARTDGVLVVHRAGRNQWTVCAANKDSHHEAIVTPHEATLLLRAWLSPVSPPPLDRLSDLA